MDIEMIEHQKAHCKATLGKFSWTQEELWNLLKKLGLDVSWDEMTALSRAAGADDGTAIDIGKLVDSVFDAIQAKQPPSLENSRPVPDASSAPAPDTENVCPPGDPHRGLSFGYLANEFIEEVRSAGYDRSAAVYAIEADVIRKKGEHLVCPRDGRLGTAYVDAVAGADSAGKADFMLSYTWGYSVGDIADTICNYLKSNLRRNYIWICCLCINQHRVQEARRAGDTVPFDDFKQAFGDRVESVHHILAMMSPWNDPVYIKRVWCVFESSMAMSTDKELSVIMPPREEEAFRSSLLSRGMQDAFALLASLRIQDASASVPEDKHAILKMLEPELSDLERSSRIASLNKKVRQKVQRWLVEAGVAWLEKQAEVDVGSVPLEILASTTSLLIDVSPDYERAEKLLNAGLAHRSTQSMAGAACLRILGRLQSRRGICAKELYSKVRAILEDCGGRGTVQYAQILIDIALSTEDIDKSLELLSESKAVYETLGATTEEDYARLLKHLGSTHRQAGHFDIAMEFYNAACQSYKSDNPQSPGAVDLITNIGQLHELKGDNDAALECYIQCRHKYELIGIVNGAGYARVCRLVGDVLVLMQRDEEAIQAFKDSVTAYEEADSSPENSGYKKALKRLAEMMPAP
eukprot:TRINITY_DN2407_c0_g3_i2.p1 TRINITY_DN2407_c0_g3~~TRINITY_DN2407_c0_g3_i2.p1  ORF type:complete len:636 (+),score=101.47 TRINITY_DN2407_c0_g3_i2:64-1971(+)